MWRRLRADAVAAAAMGTLRNCIKCVCCEPRVSERAGRWVHGPQPQHKASWELGWGWGKRKGGVGRERRRWAGGEEEARQGLCADGGNREHLSAPLKRMPSSTSKLPRAGATKWEIRA